MRAFIPFVLIAVIGIAVYGNSLSGKFLWDDEGLVQHNSYIKDWKYLPKIFTTTLRKGAGDSTNFYRPIQVFTYLLDYSVWRLNVTGYHLTNVLLHILTAISIYWLIQLLFKSKMISLLTGLFFVVHPIHTEAVAYISGRADSLVAVFMLLCFILYVKNMDKKGVITASLMGLTYVLALLSRENGLILPGLLLLYHYVFKRPVDKRQFISLICLSIGYVLWRRIVLQGPQSAPGSPSLPGPLETIPGFFVAITDYLRLLCLPFNLHMEYGGILFSFKEIKAISGIFLLSFILIYAFKKRQNQLTFWGITWFLAALLPFSNLYPLNAYMAEHWLYIPSIGFFLILARALTALSGDCFVPRNDKKEFPIHRFKPLAIIITICLLAFYSGMTIRQNIFWREPIVLYEYMLKHAHLSSKLYNNLAKAYHDKGEKDKVIALLQKAIELDSQNPEAHNNLGNAYKNIGKYKEAVSSYKKAIEINPNYAAPYYNIGMIYADIEKREEEALTLLNKALELNPYLAPAYHKIGLIFFNKGKNNEAITFLEKALKINPDYVELYHTLGYIYVHSGKMDEAKAMYHKAIEVNPDYAPVYHDLSIIYLSEEKYKSALEYCDKATALGYKDPSLLETLKQYR